MPASRSASESLWLAAQRKLCWVCRHDHGRRYKWPSLSIHHMQRRGTAYRPHQHWPENLALVCGAPCHAQLERRPHPEQLAIKWTHDQCGHASLESFVGRWLLVGDPQLKAPRRVTAAEVESHLRRAA